MKTRLILLLCAFYTICSSQEIVTINQSVEDYEFEEDVLSSQFLIFVHFTPGEYTYALDWTDIPPLNTFFMNRIKIAAVDPSFNFAPVIKTNKTISTTKETLDFKIHQEGYYVLSIVMPDSIPNHQRPNRLFIEVKKGNARVENSLSPPIVYLKYLSKDKGQSDNEWFYSKLAIPKKTNLPYTTYCAIGNDDIEFGLESITNGNSFLESTTYPLRNRIIYFKIKNENEPIFGNNIKLLKKGENVKLEYIHEDHYAFVEYLWENDTPYHFALNRRKHNGRTIYSAWLKPQTGTWTHLASFSVLDKTQSKSLPFASLAKTFDMIGHKESNACFSSMWKKNGVGEWVELNRAKVQIGDENNHKNNYLADICKENPQLFSLSAGGFLNTGNHGIILKAKKSNIKPDINIDSLNLFVEEILSPDFNQWGDVADKKVRVVSGEASDFQPGENIEQSYDNNPATLYHSPWKHTRFPVTLTYHFGGADTIDYLIYHPRVDGSMNGNFKKIELWVTEKEGKERKVNAYDLEGGPMPTRILFDTPLIHPTSVKIVVRSGNGDNAGFASCAEMEFYRKIQTDPIAEVFTDNTYSTLKPGIKAEDIEHIQNKNFRRLAQALYTQTYPTNERVRYYAPYPKPWKTAERNKTQRTYSMMDNPTGIYADDDQEIILFVGDTGGENIRLMAVDFDESYFIPRYFSLKEGMNKIKMKYRGLLYIMYHTDNEAAKPVKIHIATGNINNYFDIAQHDNNQWRTMLDNAACDYIDVLGKYAHLTFTVGHFKRHTPDITDLIQAYDSIVWLQSEFLGLHKYKRQNKNRMYFHVSQMENYYMFASRSQTGYSWETMPEVCDVNRLRGIGIWGPAHEVGHMHQTIGFNWVGLTEVSNNVYAMYVQKAFGNPSRLITEKQHSENGGEWNNRYEKGFTEILAGKIPHMKHDNVFGKLLPFWQLQLYCAETKGQTDFYADVHERIRLSPPQNTDAHEQLQFMKICCDVAQTDLTDFFEKWGMLIVFNENVADHSSIQDVVNYKKDFIITSKQVNQLKKYAAKYKKPTESIHYIHDDCIPAFQQHRPIKAGTVDINKNVITMNDWENVVVYEVYDGDQLLFVSPCSSFTIPEKCTNPIICAIPAEGNGIKVN